MTFGATWFGQGPGAPTAAHLFSCNLAHSSAANYAGHWAQFACCCACTGVSQLPALPKTVCTYIGDLFDDGTVVGTSLRPYTAAIAAQHERAGFQSPPTAPVVAAVRAGYRRDWCNLAGPHVKHVCLPPEVFSDLLYRSLVVDTFKHTFLWMGRLRLVKSGCNGPARCEP